VDRTLQKLMVWPQKRTCEDKYNA